MSGGGRMGEPVRQGGGSTRVIALAGAPGERQSWDRSTATVYLWGLIEWLLVTNSLQVSSRVRIAALRAFGAKIGENVIFRPRTRVRFPWKLSIGDNSWIGEGVWIHNQDIVQIGHDVVISQETFLSTGSHAYGTDMALKTLPITIEDGAWITARCVVLGGAILGKSALVTPLTCVRGTVPPGVIWSVDGVVRQRFDLEEESEADAD
ncbi:galactoside O-acetyltransferase [mine drainage metagenome]|uniref:Galactoside O-acetyltransferase n=1 Tax=mine drainage metagenome TaxID=410659 RepID=A0A1J5QUW9_9ZZZZ